MIKSTSYDQYEIMENILELHVPQGFIDVDPTYSKGVFYKNGRIPEPVFKSDLYPVNEDVVQANANCLPLDDESVSCVMFDPPFVIGGKTFKESKEGSCITAKRFHTFYSWDELKECYYSSLEEFHRILKDKGILVFKCQDTVASGKQHMSHVMVMNMAVLLGFYPKDLFIQLAKSRLTDGRKQKHARKFHCYWWVFEKRQSRVPYFRNIMI